MSESNESPRYQEFVLDPDVLEMIAKGLDIRASTLRAEAKRASDDGEQLHKMVEKLRD